MLEWSISSNLRALPGRENRFLSEENVNSVDLTDSIIMVGSMRSVVSINLMKSIRIEGSSRMVDSLDRAYSSHKREGSLAVGLKP